MLAQVLEPWVLRWWRSLARFGRRGLQKKARHWGCLFARECGGVIATPLPVLPVLCFYNSLLPACVMSPQHDGLLPHLELLPINSSFYELLLVMMFSHNNGENDKDSVCDLPLASGFQE